MATEKLEIIIGADVHDVVQKLDQVEKTAKATMQKTSTAFEPVTKAIEKVEVKAFDVDKAFREAMGRISDTVDKNVADAIKSFDSLESNIQSDVSSSVKAVKTLEDKFKAFGGISTNKAAQSLDHLTGKLKEVPKAATQTTTTLTNLSRVVQDAPFGFIGIANNIDPLLQSFSALRKETGSVGGALKALAGSLIGPAGIALAVSTVTSLLIAYTQSQQKAASETKKAKDESQSFADIQKEVANSVAKESTEAEKLVRILGEEGISRQNKVNALKQLKTISPEYFDGLKLEGNLVKGLSDAYAEYVKNIGLTIEAKTIEKQLEQINAKLLEGKVASEQAKVISKSLASVFQDMAKESQNSALAQKLANQTLKDNTKLTGEDLNLNFQKNILFNRLLELYKQIRVEQKGLTKDTEKDVDILKEYKLALAAIGFNEAALGINLLNEKIDLASKTFQDFISKGINPQSAAFQRVQTDLNKYLDSIKTIQKVQAELINESLDPTIKNPLPKTNPISISKADRTSSIVLTPEALRLQGLYSRQMDEIIEKQRQQVALAKELEGVLINGVGAGIDSFINALANNEDPFKALSESVKRLVVDLAAAVVKALALRAITAAISGGGSEASGLGSLFGGGGSGSVIRADQLRLLTFGRG